MVSGLLGKCLVASGAAKRLVALQVLYCKPKALTIRVSSGTVSVVTNSLPSVAPCSLGADVHYLKIFIR